MGTSPPVPESIMSEYLKKAGRKDVQDVLSHCKSLGTIYRHHNKGWTNDSGRTMRHVASVPLWVLFDPEYKKYFDPQHDSHELKKDIDKFLKKTDWTDFRKL